MKKKYFGIYFNNNIPKLNKKKKYIKSIKIIFDGTAYLINNQQKNSKKLQIKSEYILKKPGEYTLEYTNTTGDFYSINFILKKYNFYPLIIYLLFFLYILFISNKLVYNNNIIKDIACYIKENEKEEKTNNNEVKYVFKVNGYNTEFKEINLWNTMDRKMMINEKIAPGVSGKFQIVIDTMGSNTNMEYKIQFSDETVKPTNLLFSAQGKEENIRVNSLKELEKQLNGKIEKNEIKTITIYWKWEYENKENKDLQDTKDGERLNTYKFKILVTGRELTERR